MASKFGLAGGIPERRVRPIWDAIDSRQFKSALKHATTLLAKHPNSPYALALKALILERMGKNDEALSICLDAKELLHKNDSMLMDDLTLSTLQIVFQRLDHLELATSCYEHACGKFPNNLELLMGLFNCYVREYSFVKQQQTAIKMYKLVGEERFLLWAVCSIQLQVLCGNGGEKLLLLAEGLLKKHIASHSLHEPEAIFVYISILEQQSKYGDALEILSGKLGSLLMIEVDKLRIQGRLLARASDYATAALVYQKILELSPDDWECFLHYLGCLLEDDSSWCNSTVNDPIHPPKFVECKFSQLGDETFVSRISNASAFVQKLQADNNSKSIRGPYLANLEIERRKCLYGKKNEDELIEALMQYFLKFGHLACFTSDVEMFLDVLSLDKKMEFLDKIKISDSILMVPTKVLGQSITIFKIQELIGVMYKLPVDGYGKRSLEIISMKGHRLFWRTRNLGYFLEAIMVLEFGLTIRRCIWRYKILLLHLYSHIGALSLAYEWYKALDVKNILMETVSHHILPQMLVSPLWADLSNLLKDYLKFMDDHFRESADLTFLAYRHRNYSKVIEFVQFKERLQHSNQYLVARVETPILQLKQNTENIEEEERVLENLKCGIHFVELSNEIGSKSLTFNEDLQLLPWWKPTPEKNSLLGPFEGLSYYPKEDLTRERESNVRRTIGRRSLIPRMIYLSIQCASASFKETLEVNGSILDPKISTELKLLLEHYAEMLGFSFSNAIELVVEASCGKKPSEACSSDVIDWINFAVFLNAWNLNSHELMQQDGEKKGHGTWHVVNSLLEKSILDKVGSMESPTSSPQGELPILVQLVTEPLAWHILVIQACIRASLPSGKRKKKSGHTEQSFTPMSLVIRDSLQSLCGITEEVAKWLGNQVNVPEDDSAEAILSSFQREGQEGGRGQVFQVLQILVASIDEAELGNQISQALRSWSPADVARKIVTSQHSVLSEFLKTCESKIKSLKALKQQIAHV
ncbi:N-terminal acetyltransferase B complex auxiliary subunit NAA25 [Carica papaya]|uniref:N-terminal acetyltransferase B complex auxiliary subunit NAA25 n=1 Tax=Carica papaya TaxID=3649 RepID=UPI000B8C73F6|nr:N-terminal acetyltransferase B complex auxiliary subunit NAA25 [Carica papaya]